MTCIFFITLYDQYVQKKFESNLPVASADKFTSGEMVTSIFSSSLHPVAKVKVKRKKKNRGLSPRQIHIC